MEEIRTKKCTKCGRVLPITEFHKKAAAKDGLQYTCKDCQAKDNKERFAKNKIKREDKLEVLFASSSDGKVIKTNKCFSNPELAKFTPRELMRELASRGYIGRIEYIERKVIDITKM